MTATNSTFWVNSYLRAALPAVGVTGFNAGLALNITMNNASALTIVMAVVVLGVISKMAFSHLSSKEDYLWFLGDDAKKSRLIIGYTRLIGVGVFLGTPLMSVAQYGDTMTKIVSVLVLSWLLVTEGYRFDKTVKSLKE